jgi:ATP-dependent RNA helicase RhlB
MNLPEPLLRAVEDLGFETPTPIQSKALPVLLGGSDLAGQAQTGTGKTACFLLAAMTRLLETKRPKNGVPRCLVVAPTRELAIQIAEDAVGLCVHTDLDVVTCYGGTGWEAQARAVQRGCDIVVGTPGRLIDYCRKGILILDRVEVFVLDEADRMFDMGFIKDINYLFRKVPPKGKRQALLFSATLSQSVMRLAWRFMVDPVEISVKPDQVAHENIEQSLYHVSSREKLPLLLGLIRKEQPGRAMLFVNMKRTGEELCWRLNQNGVQTVYMSGDISQKKRQRIIEALKKGQIDFLVATDVASRGIHADDVTHIFNWDIPEDPEDYVHRIGRTARAGASGTAITLACENYVIGLPAVEKYIGHKIPVQHVEDEMMAPDQSGYFRRRRGSTFCGWPLGADTSGNEGFDASPESDRGGRGGGGRGGGGGGRGRRSGGRDNRRPRRDDAPRGDGGRKREESRDRKPAAPSSDAPRPKRQRVRRRIGDGGGSSSD